MKITDLKFKNDYRIDTSSNLTFLQTCLEMPLYETDLIDGGKAGFHAFVNQTLKNSDNTAAFTDRFLAETKYQSMMCYQEILKRERPDMAKVFVRKNFGKRCFELFSYGGGVRIGTKNFSFVVKNGRGRVTKAAVFESRDAFYSKYIMEHVTDVGGKFFILDDDCRQVIACLKGRYDVYAYNGLVAFVPFEGECLNKAPAVPRSVRILNDEGKIELMPITDLKAHEISKGMPVAQWKELRNMLKKRPMALLLSDPNTEQYIPFVAGDEEKWTFPYTEAGFFHYPARGCLPYVE